MWLEIDQNIAWTAIKIRFIVSLLISHMISHSWIILFIHLFGFRENFCSKHFIARHQSQYELQTFLLCFLSSLHHSHPLLGMHTHRFLWHS